MFGLRHLALALGLLALGRPAAAQERKPMLRPYIDQRKFHWGFHLGMHFLDMEVKNSGRVNPQTGEQWYAEVERYSPGLSVGVLGAMRLNKHFELRVLPTMHYGQRHMWFHEQRTGQDTTHVLKNVMISVPVEVKFAAPRHNNFRPYFVAGVSPTFDLINHTNELIDTSPFDLMLEVGMGCDIYFSFFKLHPELKFSFGVLDILRTNREGTLDPSLLRFGEGLDAAHSKMISLTFYFE